MPLTSMVPMLNRAREKGYAVGIFIVHTLEGLLAALEAAGEERSPVILGPGGGLRSAAGVRFIEKLAASSLTPVAVELDHGRDLVGVMAAINAGFTDVMIDASSLPYDRNVALTRQVVEVAHCVGVGVEGEIGRIGTSANYGNTEARLAGLTQPEEAAQFVADTGVDILAVSIGSAHGMGRAKSEPELDFGRLGRIRATVNVPLVLHGGSGITDDDFRRAISGGICKVNIHTSMSLAATDAMRAALADPANGYWQIGGLVQRAIKGVVAHHMRVFGSAGQA